MNVCSPKGCGVAVGYFQSLENCKKALTTFEEKYNAPGFINEVIKKDSSEYILIIGCLEQKKDAAALLRRLKKDLPEAHIISFLSV
jgi:hypothetical protein